ncbi:guanylate kinase [Candidatus Synchoanobacter obligatus]|uniref:Guanylate kinase n=1 Tax=Candidatus Synchoanobacter obligatus TaxID=2919597 RepID=A0ABT1L592_9GAMM|nr:guanylate kinase [Candidatus Synchoanobacter obligatus]MCP8352345.1 guanylate kinase [Candidatus Synchoanobacter obligatus]
MLKQNIFVMTGPSGVGKSVLVNRLIESGLVKRCITCTTRQMRSGETPGVDYHFYSEAVFSDKVSKGEFLEVNQHYENWYGVRHQDIDAMLDQHNVVLLLNWEGALKIKADYPNAMTIFLEPPSLQILEKRLKNRDDSAKRMVYAHEDMQHVDDFDYRLLNDNIDKTFDMLCEIIHEAG